MPFISRATWMPIARAISLPVNHLTMTLLTVMPAISQPTPKRAKPALAQMTCSP